jgi:hypothetical protein
MAEYNPECLCCERRKYIDSILRNAALLSQHDLDLLIKMAEELAKKREYMR